MTSNLHRTHRALLWLVAGISFYPIDAHASFLHSETLDKVADVMSWIVLIIVPLVGIVIFWLVHILPEKIAEKRKHPQAGAIQCLCLLSLVFGGLLWPIAWLWAYSKPVLYKLAYGTDVEEESHLHSSNEEIEHSALPADGLKTNNSSIKNGRDV